MNLISPELLQVLGRSRILPNLQGGAGVGDRRARGTGTGLEFEDHRLYQPGDDTRHLDRHAYARHGRPYIKQFRAEGQLPVTVLLDVSASMSYGHPDKLACAKRIVLGFAHVVLVGGDNVSVAAISDVLDWFPRVQGRARLASLDTWLASMPTRGVAGLDGQLNAVAPRLAKGGLTIAVSDWLFEGAENVISTLAATQQRLVVVHVLAREECEPSLIGEGLSHLVDAETGQELEIALGSEVSARYQLVFGAWIQGLEHAATRAQALYLRVLSDVDLAGFFTVRCRQEGLIQ